MIRPIPFSMWQPESSDGRRGKAARRLGISERNLYRELREYGLLS